jgi:hypothetical protein
MHLQSIKPIRPLLLVTAIIGFAAINGPFLYFALLDKETYAEAMSNGIALVFMGEAFLLMFLFAFIIAKMGWKKPGWVFFIAMSLLGSMAFSVPLQLYLMTGPDREV